MRAEEGNESLRDYAVEGEQTLGKIKKSQRARSPIGRLVSRIAKVFRGERDHPGGGQAG
jgi:hypothetical protein